MLFSAAHSHHKRCMSLRHLFIMCRHRRQFITGPWSMVLHIITAITGTVTGDPLWLLRDPVVFENSYLSPTTVSCVRLAHTRTSKIERRQAMTRMLILATFSLAATTLPLLAQTPNGPVQGAVQGTVKGTAMVGQGMVQGTGQAGQGIAQGSASVARGAGQATIGVARGAGTVAAKTGRGAWCIVTLGYGC